MSGAPGIGRRRGRRTRIPRGCYATRDTTLANGSSPEKPLLSPDARIGRIARGSNGHVEPYLLAALVIAGTRLISRHVLPNVLTVALVRASLDIGPVTLSEATLSFLGIGIQPPIPSWGVMIADSFKHLRTYPYQAIIPCITLSGAILALTFVGEGIAEALDPRWRRR